MANSHGPIGCNTQLRDKLQDTGWRNSSSADGDQGVEPRYKQYQPGLHIPQCQANSRSSHPRTSFLSTSVFSFRFDKTVPLKDSLPYSRCMGS